MNKEIINIGIVSKGRLKLESEKIFKKKKLKIYSDKRELLGRIKDQQNIRVLFLHAREIVEQVAIGKLDAGISGFDIYKESEINIQKKIKVEKKLNFGFANLVLAVREEFIDVFTTLDLDEVADEFKKKNKRLIRIGSKYPNLTRQYLYSRGVTNFSIVKSRGATELMPAISTAELISDITSSGQTLTANKLRVLNDGIILKSQACIFISKKNQKKKGLKRILSILSK